MASLENNLYLVGYSTFQRQSNFKELKNHLHTLPSQPNATVYHKLLSRAVGFCLTQEQFDSLEDGIYEVCIDTKLFDEF